MECHLKVMCSRRVVCLLQLTLVQRGLSQTSGDADVAALAVAPMLLAAALLLIPAVPITHRQ